MKHLYSYIIIGLFCFSVLSDNHTVHAKEPAIKALLITGGCCHDYERQKLILSKGISARINVEWTIVQQGGKTTDTKIPVYKNADWAEGFDIVVHNECFSHVKDKKRVDQILKPHREGTPAILIHCAMHCYRTGDDRWFEFCGMQSPGHGKHFSYLVDNVKPSHPIMKGFGKQWRAPKGELYHSIKLWDTATALGQAKRESDGEPQICVWTNQYHKGRVFATTIGHYNETMAEPKYLDMLARGMLWALDKSDKSDIKKTSQETNEEIFKLVSIPVSQAVENVIAGSCCGEGNLAFGRKTSSKSQQQGHPSNHAVDGKLNTRFCANGAQKNEWWQVDLENPEHVKSLRIHWESKAVYKYIVEASADGKIWKKIVDASTNKKPKRIAPHKVDSPDTRYLRITFLGANKGQWFSFWEFEAYIGDLPKLPKQKKETANAATVKDVQAPAELEVRLFGTPPEVNYPVCLSCAPTGEVFVGVDEMGSLGKEPNRGKIVRCIDADGDGKAEYVNEFCKIDHPRGLIYDQGKLWVLAPPQLVLFHDDDLDGVADRKEILIEGISTKYVGIRGADHTTNGIRMGIDGWIYIAVGDYGVVAAKGTDGTVLNRRGGGIIRIRPDGTEMEFFAWGLRNILDVCIDPCMNIFTRDNTNDGGGWDIRVSHILQGAEYGYPSWYANFAEEIMPPLGDYGGGSGCGGMYFHDLSWPAPFNDALYTCDWGRSEVYRHNLAANGATFDPHQEVFLKIPRPTDIDVDGRGLMYVSSWKNGKFAYDGPNIGFVAQLRPKNYLPKPFPRLNELDDAELVKMLRSSSAVRQLHTQREILRRGPKEKTSQLLWSLIADENAPRYARSAAIFTFKQLNDKAANAQLLEVVQFPEIRDLVLKALTDRKAGLKELPLEPFIEALHDKNPRVQAQALISLARLNRQEAASSVLPLTKRTQGELPPPTRDQHKQPDPGRVIPHLAVRTLVKLKASKTCLEGLGGSFRDGALWALKYMHDPKVIEALIQNAKNETDMKRREEILALLIRLYFKEGKYTEGWWGTRPDHTGPYFMSETWQATPQIAEVIRKAYLDPKHSVSQIFLKQQLIRHKVKINGLPEWTEKEANEINENKPISIPKVDPNNKNQIANIPYEKTFDRVMKAKGEVKEGKRLFISQACNACHTNAEGQTPKGPHLVDIGKRYKREELIESILKPSAKIAQGFDTYVFIMEDGKQHVGFATSESAETIHIRKNDGVAVELILDEIEFRKKQEQSMMPIGLVNNLTPEQLASLVDYLNSLRSGKKNGSKKSK